MIGPGISADLLSSRSTTPGEEEDPGEAGPSASIGPEIPPEIRRDHETPTVDKPPEENDDEDEDDYVPSLPPDLAAARAGHFELSSASSSSSRLVKGPALPAGLQRPTYSDEEDEDDYGPRPLPTGVTIEETDGVREFLEKEERRRKHVEEAAKPKTLKREEWMLVPPSASDLLGSINPAKLTKARQFARTSAPARDVDTSLWTETPAERQQRLADEVSGKRRRAANADPDALDESAELETRKRLRKDEEVRKGVEEYTRQHRGPTLIEQHSEKSEKEAKDKSDESPVIWDHTRDMAVGGRLMDDKTRNKFINDARGLSDRFGTGKGGGFL